ncbi:sigma factor G inhibitor Gin [Desulfoscipio sp. XC116]|uniref:sigma factor G inhibitor Gin n=1 Tax=Desulfoscipio sp. XC116 TaxID=3144975 RepID=UPI00325B0205
MKQGICIWGYYICSDCEEKICCLTMDSIDYEYYRNGFKSMWCLADNCSPSGNACF